LINEQVDDIEQWLTTKGSTLWADWIVTSPDGRKQAAEWFAKEMLDFAIWRSNLKRNKLSQMLVNDNFHNGAFTVDV
jgi:hypothetical protein